MVATAYQFRQWRQTKQVLVFTQCGYKLYMGAVNGHGPVQVAGVGAR